MPLVMDFLFSSTMHPSTCPLHTSDSFCRACRGTAYTTRVTDAKGGDISAVSEQDEAREIVITHLRHLLASLEGADEESDGDWQTEIAQAAYALCYLERERAPQASQKDADYARLHVSLNAAQNYVAYGGNLYKEAWLRTVQDLADNPPVKP